jgi:hypothetical protein
LADASGIGGTAKSKIHSSVNIYFDGCGFQFFLYISFCTMSNIQDLLQLRINEKHHYHYKPSNVVQQKNTLIPFAVNFVI